MPAPDRKKRSGATPRPKQQSTPASSGVKRPLLSGLLVGFLLGAGSVGLIWLDHHSPHEAPCSAAGSAGSSQSSSTEKDSETPTPHFDFYNMLPAGPSSSAPSSEPPQSSGNIHPANHPKATAKKAEPKQPSTPATERYDLQCGSYKTQDEADGLRASLILHGTHALIRPSHLPDGSIRFRVISGPYDGVKAAHQARTALVDAGFNCIALRRQ